MSLPQPLAGQAFRLTHPNMEFLLFYAETTDLANNWLEKLEGACDPTKLLISSNWVMWLLCGFQIHA